MRKYCGDGMNLFFSLSYGLNCMTCFHFYSKKKKQLMQYSLAQKIILTIKNMSRFQITSRLLIKIIYQSIK